MPTSSNPLSTSSAKPLPGSNTVLILGLLSILGSVFAGLPGFIFGTTGLVMSKRARLNYLSDPGRWPFQSFQNLTAGRICCVAGLVASLLFFYLFAPAIFAA
jgi:hypothetical protein